MVENNNLYLDDNYKFGKPVWCTCQIYHQVFDVVVIDCWSFLGAFESI